MVSVDGHYTHLCVVNIVGGVLGEEEPPPPPPPPPPPMSSYVVSIVGQCYWGEEGRVYLQSRTLEFSEFLCFSEIFMW